MPSDIDITNTDDELASDSGDDSDYTADGQSIDEDSRPTNMTSEASAADIDEDIGVSIKSVKDIERDGIIWLTGYDNKKKLEKLKREPAPPKTKIVSLGVVYEDLPDKGFQDDEVVLNELAVLKTPDGQHHRALPMSPDSDESRNVLFLRLSEAQERALVKRCATAAKIKCDYTKWANVQPGCVVKELEGKEVALFGKHMCLSTALASKILEPPKKRKKAEPAAPTKKRLKPTPVETTPADTTIDLPPVEHIETHKPVEVPHTKTRPCSLHYSFESPEHMHSFFGTTKPSQFRPHSDTEMTLYFETPKDTLSFLNSFK